MPLDLSTVRVAESFMSTRHDMHCSSNREKQDRCVSDALVEDEDVSMRYCKACSVHDVKPNSAVKKVLSAHTATLALKHALIGDRGALALADCLRRLSSLTSLDLRSNSLRNKGTIAICNSLVFHPSLSSLDLRQNAFSIGAKHSLLRVAASNIGVLKQLLIMPNDINMAVQDAINRILQSDRYTTTLSNNSQFLLHKKLSNSGDLSTVDSTTELNQPPTPTQELQEVVQGWSISIAETGPNVLWDSPRPSREENGSNNGFFMGPTVMITSSEPDTDSQIGAESIAEPQTTIADKEEGAAPTGTEVESVVDTEDTFSHDGLMETSDMTQNMNRLLLDGSFDQRRQSLQTVDASVTASVTAKGICQEIYRKSVSELTKRNSSTLNQEGASACSRPGPDVDLDSDLSEGLILQEEQFHPFCFHKQNTFDLEGDLESRQQDRRGTGRVVHSHVRLLDGNTDQPRVSADSTSPAYLRSGIVLVHRLSRELCRTIIDKAVGRALSTETNVKTNVPSAKDEKPKKPKREKVLYSQRSITDAFVLQPMSESLLDDEYDVDEENGNGKYNGSVAASDVLSPIYRKSVQRITFRASQSDLESDKITNGSDIPFDEEQIQALHHALTLALEGMEKPTSPRRKMTMLPIDDDARGKDSTS